jgi:DsbC/DsbD-like thiol-disulfide interchange protein
MKSGERKMIRTPRKLFALLLLVVSGVATSRAEDPHPIQWSLISRASTLPLRKGSPVEATLHAKILPGWHLYAMDQLAGGPTATRMNLQPNQPFVLVGSIEPERAPIIMNDPNFNLESRYYEGEASFRFSVKATSPASAAQAKLTVDVLFQTCNDRMCLPPSVVHVSTQVQAGR